MSLSHSPRIVSDGIVMDLKASSLATSVSRNLLVSPEDLANGSFWSLSGATVQSNVAMAPDGSFTADKVVGNFGATARKGVFQFVTGLQAGQRYTFSVYLKSAGYTTAMIWHDSNPFSQPSGFQGAGSLLNLSTGVSSNNAFTTMNDVGNGWYRCQTTAVYPYSSSYNYSITMGEANGGLDTPTGNGVDGIFVWGAQLERTGLAVPLPSFEVNFNLGQTSPLITYTRSTVGTFYNSSGLVTTAAINTPRYDHDPVTFTNRGLLLESAATNWIPNSTQSTTQFSFVGGTSTSLATSNNPSSASAVSNSVRALAATDTVSQIRYMLRAETWTGTQINIFSAFFKNISANVTYPTLVIDDGLSGGVYARFDLLGNGTVVQSAFTGTAVNYGAGIERLPNGWYRCWIVGTPPAGAGRAAITFRNNTNTTNGYDPGFSATAIGDGVFVWGPMIEKNVGDRRKPSSYYETTGSVATRGADSAVVTGSNFTSWFNNTEGTILIEYYKSNETTFGGFTWPMSISDGTINNQISFYNINGGTAVTNISYNTGGAAQLDYLQVNTNSGINKLAQSYKTNQVAFAANGSLIGVDYTNTTPVVNRLTIGNSYAGGNDLNDRVSRIIYWPKALSPTEVTALTNLWSSLTTTVGVAPTPYYPVSSNTFSTNWTDSSTSTRNLALTQIQVLVVAGGGSGASTGAGGGAGGLVYNSAFTVTPGTSYTATVGAGGVAPIYPSSVNGPSGGNSIFGSITAIGGGGGRFHGDSQPGGSGGSGGGAAVITLGSPGAGGAGTPGQGNDGGAGFLDASWVGAHGGGGGAGGRGNPGGNIQGSGNGGPGLAYDISGTLTFYAGGGGGGEVNGSVVGKGGIGGGGDGFFDAAGTPGTPNTGGGGGGGGYGSPPPAPSFYTDGGAGGSGVVIVRYPQPVRATGGTITLVGNDVVHTFRSGTSSFVVESSTIQLQNSPAFNALNTSVTLNGINQYVDCGNASVLNVGNIITVIAWFNPLSISTYGPVVTKVSNDFSSGWELANSSGALRVSLRPGPAANLDLSGGVLPLNTWSMGAFTFDGTTCRLYLNGNQTVSGVPSGTIALNSTQSLWVGGRVQGNYFAGDISQVTVYSRVLTAAEILQNFDALRGRYGI